MGKLRMKKLIISLCLAGAFSAPVHAQALEPGAPVIQVQSGDAAYRVSVLEEQVRQLNGRIEELTFQLLEMQEKIRRTQEDNDYRLRELEDKQGNLSGKNSSENLASNSGTQSLEKPEPSESNNTIVSSGGNEQNSTSALNPKTEKRTIDGVEIYSGESGVGDSGTGTLGSIQFDANGNIVDSELGAPVELGGNNLASLNEPLPQDPEGLFNFGYDNVQIGRYQDAERALVAFSQQYASHPRMPEARFWLGESYLGRKQFQKAAQVYLDAHKKWPNSKYGPQSLLKLGVSVAGLNQRELACATFAEVLAKYPNASRALKRNVLYEQNAAQCAIN